MLNWLVAGIGDIAKRRVIPAIQADPRSRLYGVVTRDPSKGRLFTERIWTDLDEALADPAIGAVYVATPVSWHAPQTIASLRAGKHVLCEKPVAMNFTEASEMTRAARQAKCLFGIAYYRRFYPKVLRAKQLINEGVIGQPVLAEANCHSEIPVRDGQRAWLLDPALAGGGPLYDIACHRIDVLNLFFGEPRRATGQLSNAIYSLDVEDNATVLIEYANGVRAVVDVRWHSRIARDQFRIIGTEGEMNLDPLNGPLLRYPGGEENLPCNTNVHLPCIENFSSAVLDGTPLAASGESSIHTDWITDQVVLSNRANQVR